MILVQIGTCIPKMYDLILSSGGRLHGVEIKSAQTFNKNMLSALVFWQNLEPTINQPTTLVYGGSAQQRIGQVQLKNWQSFIFELNK
jgi:hypothetical protein